MIFTDRYKRNKTYKLKFDITVLGLYQVQRDKQAQKRRVEDLERTLEEAQEGISKESERRGEAEGNYMILKNEVQSNYRGWLLIALLSFARLQGTGSELSTYQWVLHFDMFISSTKNQSNWFG